MSTTTSKSKAKSTKEKNQFRPPAVPLITVDPYFSVWSTSDNAYDSETTSWTGATKPINGFVTIDSQCYCFLGKRGDDDKALTQTSLEITATASKYTFVGKGIQLEVTFRTPQLLFDLDIASRPCNYIDFAVRSTDDNDHEVSVELSFDPSHCYDGERNNRPMFFGETNSDAYQSVWMGLAKQGPLSNSGDNITIDWGYLYLATVPNAKKRYELSADGGCAGTLHLKAKPSSIDTGFFVVAYDDLASICYFGEMLRGYWARDGKTIMDMITSAVQEHNTLVRKCEVFDAQLKADCLKTGSQEYADICALSYRHSIGGHKIVADRKGNVLFLSKENDSNGCIGTVDVSYPSIPLYLVYNPELVKGMMRPIFEFARMPVWKYDYAPHDVGRYPYACGQVYGLSENLGKLGTTANQNVEQGDIFPMFYQFPASTEVYDHKYQMPVEECGNMLVMCAAVAMMENNADFAAENMDLLEKWVCYLVEYGRDPGEQLCTDDFAGHLAHNVNLSAKAIMGIASYGLILNRLGKTEEGEGYLNMAADMAKDWEKRADAGDHTRLSFEDRNSWSIKYNTVWDLLFETGLFTESFFDREIEFYQKKTNDFGLPLDSRETYTKSDWIVWCSAMAKNTEDFQSIIKPLYRYINETPSRVPYSDWYDTKTSKFVHFINRTVQGGMFMPLLKNKVLANK